MLGVNKKDRKKSKGSPNVKLKNNNKVDLTERGVGAGRRQHPVITNGFYFFKVYSRI